jgi:hypothetical protein
MKNSKQKNERKKPIDYIIGTRYLNIERNVSDS